MSSFLRPYRGTKVIFYLLKLHKIQWISIIYDLKSNEKNIYVTLQSIRQCGKKYLNWDASFAWLTFALNACNIKYLWLSHKTFKILISRNLVFSIISRYRFAQRGKRKSSIKSISDKVCWWWSWEEEEKNEGGELKGYERKLRLRKNTI